MPLSAALGEPPPHGFRFEVEPPFLPGGDESAFDPTGQRITTLPITMLHQDVPVASGAQTADVRPLVHSSERLPAGAVKELRRGA